MVAFGKNAAPSADAHPTWSKCGERLTGPGVHQHHAVAGVNEERADRAPDQAIGAQHARLVLPERRVGFGNGFDPWSFERMLPSRTESIPMLPIFINEGRIQGESSAR